MSWTVAPVGVITDKPRGTATRAPGTTQGHAIIENLMEHMASKLGEDPIEFRIKNMLKEGDCYHSVPRVVLTFKISNLDKRFIFKTLMA